MASNEQYFTKKGKEIYYKIEALYRDVRLIRKEFDAIEQPCEICPDITEYEYEDMMEQFKQANYCGLIMLKELYDSKNGAESFTVKGKEIYDLAMKTIKQIEELLEEFDKIESAKEICSIMYEDEFKNIQCGIAAESIEWAYSLIDELYNPCEEEDEE